MDGWIKLHRCLLEKAIWQLNDAQRIVFITVLLLANHTGKQWLWKGTQFNAEPGQFVTSLPKLAKIARVSVQSVRTALDNLRKLDFLTDESTDTGRLITVTNWAFYQRKEKESTDQSTDDQQTINRPSTSTKNGKKVKNETLFTEENPEPIPKPPKTRTIVNEYYDLFVAKYSQKPANMGKIAKILNDIVKEIGDEETNSRLKRFFNDDNEFVTNSFHAVEMFKTKVNQYVSVKPQTPPKPIVMYSGPKPVNPFD